MERKSERIKKEKDKKSSNTLNQIHDLIQNISFLEIKEKMSKLIEIYKLMNNNFELLYETKKCISFFYIAFKKKEEIKAFLEKEINNEIKIRNISNQFLKQSTLFDKKFLEIIDSKFNNLQNNSQILEYKNNFCPICLEIILKKEKFISICNHIYHKKCVLDQLKHSNFCPMCRRDLF